MGDPKACRKRQRERLKSLDNGCLLFFETVKIKLVFSFDNEFAVNMCEFIKKNPALNLCVCVFVCVCVWLCVCVVGCVWLCVCVCLCAYWP